MDPCLYGCWKWDLWDIKLFCLDLFGAADSGFVSGVAFAQLNTRDGEKVFLGFHHPGKSCRMLWSEPSHSPHSQRFPWRRAVQGCTMGCIHRLLNQIQPLASVSNHQLRVGSSGIPHGWGNTGPLQVHISGWTANFGLSVCTHCFLQQGSAKNKQVSREEGVKAAGSMGRCQYWGTQAENTAWLHEKTQPRSGLLLDKI